MAHNYAAVKAKNTATPQTQAIPGREKEMAENNAGGFSFVMDKWRQLQRFLVLGSDSPTYYSSASALTKVNTENLTQCIKEDGPRVLAQILQISEAGRAAKNDPAIYALALCFKEGNQATRAEAAEVFPRVCRTGTHMFTFVHFLDSMSNWNNFPKKAISNWYNSKTIDSLVTQVIKYAGRTVEGTCNQWTHKDVLRVAHVRPLTPEHNAIYGAITDGKTLPHPLAKAVEKMGKLVEKKDFEGCVKLLSKNNIPHDAWPTEAKNDAGIWRQALPNMQYTALLRNLNKLTALGVLKPFGTEVKEVCATLTDPESIKRARIHPLNLLNAFRTYSQGHGFRGSLSWTPITEIQAAIETAFYASFKYLDPINKRILLGLDVSESMTGQVSVTSPLTHMEVSAAMSMSLLRTATSVQTMAFSNTFQNLPLTAHSSLNEAIKMMNDMDFGSTDCSLPIRYAYSKGLEVDAFLVFTDNETWSGGTHPAEALRIYRKRYVKDAKLVVLATTGTQFTIADPKDPGMLDIAGFDSAVPSLVSSFLTDKI